MTFSAWLAMQHSGIPMLVVVGFFLAFGAASVLGLRLFVRESTLQRHNEIAGFVFAALGAIYAVLLAFVVFVVWEEHSAALDVAESEAMHAISLYRDLSAYPDKGQAEPALAALKAFSASVVEDEYPALRQHRWAGAYSASVRTDERFRSMWDAVKGIVPHTMQEQSIFQEQLKDVNVLGEERRKRLLQARDDLPRVIWLAILIGGMVTVGFPALFGHESVLSKLVLTWLLGLVVGFVVLVIVRLNYPFLGADRIDPAGYEILVQLAKW
jgi:hypothetical protein